jgi:hypothetical protein
MSLYLCPAKPRSKFTNESSVASSGLSSKMASRSPGPARSRLQCGPFAYCLFGNEVIWSPMLASKLVWHSHPARLVLMPAHFLATGRRDIKPGFACPRACLGRSKPSSRNRSLLPPIGHTIEIKSWHDDRMEAFERSRLEAGLCVGSVVVKGTGSIKEEVDVDHVLAQVGGAFQCLGPNVGEEIIGGPASQYIMI